MQISIRNKYLVSRDWVKCKVSWPRRHCCNPQFALHHDLDAKDYVDEGVLAMPRLQVFGRDITDA